MIPCSIGPRTRNAGMFAAIGLGFWEYGLSHAEYIVRDA